MSLPLKYTDEEIKEAISWHEVDLKEYADDTRGGAGGYPSGANITNMIKFNEAIDFLLSTGMQIKSLTALNEQKQEYRMNTLLIRPNPKYNNEYYFYPNSNKWRARNRTTTYRSKGVEDFFNRFIKCYLDQEAL